MIGEIIKEHRALKNMSRKVLSEGICSEKYVYLIEKNERNPSAYILDQFSERIGIDLFEYYQYLNFKNKTLVVEYKKEFDRYIKLGDIKKLKEVSIKASKVEDFKSEPLCYDILITDLLYKGLAEGKTSEAIAGLIKIFQVEKLNIDNLTLINGYIALSTCYQIEGKLRQARKVIEIAYGMVRHKTKFSRYTTVTINVLISLTSFLYSNNEYEELIKYANALLEFQEKHSEFSRIYYADFYLSFGYFKTKDFIKSEEHFIRGIHSACLFKNKMDLNLILKMEDFKVIVDDLEINPYYIERFYELAN